MNLGEEIEKVKGEYGRKNGGADKEPGCESVGQKIKLLKAFIWCKRGKKGRRTEETGNLQGLAHSNFFFKLCFQDREYLCPDVNIMLH